MTTKKKEQSEELVSTAPYIPTHENAMSDDHVLDMVKNVRGDLLSDMLSDGMPQKGWQQEQMLSLLRDMDHSANAGKRLVKEDSDDARNAETARLLSAVVERMGNQNPHVIIQNPTNVVDHQVVLPEIELLPGETAVGDSSVNYETFTANSDQEE